MRFSLTVCALMSLAACGSSGSGLSPELERVNNAVALATEIDGFARTRFDAVPTSGTARFVGFADITIDPDPTRQDDNIGAIGDARIVADFAASTVTGSVTNMSAVIGVAGIPTAADFVPVAGQINLGNGDTQIGSAGAATLSPNEFITGYEGTMMLQDETYRIIGDLDGYFVGTRINLTGAQVPIRGLYAEDLNGLALDGDGDDAAATLTIYAENPLN